MKSLCKLDHVAAMAFAALLVTQGGCPGPRGNNGGGGPGGGDGEDLAGIPNVEYDLASPATCSGLECMQVQCGELSSVTTLKGTVYAPNGTLPIYNAIVYIPNAKVTAFTNGVSCDRCNGLVSGNPLVQALTGPDGKFTLVNVPAGNNIPLVIQIGKWRRQVTIPSVPQCVTSVLPASLTSLPKNHAQGDMPMMAIATGGADPMECLLLKIGIDKNEIKEPGNGTRVEFYQGANSPGTLISDNTPSAADPNNGLYTQMKRLYTYDIVMFPCEGGEYDQTGTSNIAEYVNAGGRVFATHYSYDWLTYTNSPFNKIASPLQDGEWPKDQMDYPSDDTMVTVANLITNFPKGLAFAQWLKFAGASSPTDKLNIEQIRHDINGVDPNYAQAWATDTLMGDPFDPTTPTAGVAQLTFNTPLDPPKNDGGVAEYCGRVVYSDFHVAQSEVDPNQTYFPDACLLGAMSDQEKALAFMLFDLSSCVQSDSQPPIF